MDLDSTIESANATKMYLIICLVYIIIFLMVRWHPLPPEQRT